MSLQQRAMFARKYPSYEVWIAEVDHHLARLCGMGHEDLPDWDTRNAYDTHVQPKDAAQDIIDAAKEY